MATLETLLSQQMIERLGWTLIHFVWQAAAVALLLAAVLRGLRRSSSNVRYVVSCLALALIVALPLVTMLLVEVSRPVAEAGPILDDPPVMRTTPVEVAELPPEPFDAPVAAMPERVAHIPWTQRAANALEPALPWLVFGWLLGVFGLSAWHLGGWAQLQRMKWRMVSQVAERLHAALADLSNRLGVRRDVELLESALVEVPTVVGWVKPVILLPASALAGLRTEQLEAILAHELAHVRRCDYLVNLIQTVVEILGFYHPAVWWISHRIREERENCCDDLAVEVCGDSRRYARALTCLEELRHHSTELAVAASGGSLVGRIARLLGRPPIDNRRFAWLPGLIALLLVVAILIPAAFVLAAPEQVTPMDTPAPQQAPAATISERMTQTLPADPTSDRPTVVVNFLLFANPMPNKIVDTETRRRIGEVLAPEIPSAREGLAAMQNATVTQILRTWIAGRPLTPYTTEVLVDVLQSRGYLQGEATPEILVTDNVPGHMNLITEELTLPAEDPTSSPKPITLGAFVQLTPHVPPAPSDRITLEIAATWKTRIGSPDPNDNPTIRSTEIASTVTVLKDHYFTLLAEPEGASNSKADPSQFHLLIFRADLLKPTSALSQTPPSSQPPSTPVPVPSASEQATLDARREFVRTDPMVRELMQRIAQVEIELIEARQKSVPQHPEIIQKEQLLEALHRRLDERRHELRQEIHDLLARTPDADAGRMPETTDAEPGSGKTGAVEVTARFVLVDPECLDGLRRGLPIQGVTAPADVNALHEIGNDLAEGRTPLLKPDRVELLLRAVGQYAGSKMVAAPRVTVLDGESASMHLSSTIAYVSGYREPNDASPEPIAQHASKEVGMRLDATPHFIEDQNNIRLQFKMEINSLLGMQKALYRGRYEYDVPTFTAVTTATEIVAADGQTALIYIGETPSVGNILRNESEPRGCMLLLIKPSRTKAEPANPVPSMQPGHRPGDPGMGQGMQGLPPGRPPFHPPLSS